MTPVCLPDFFLYPGFNSESCTSIPWNWITNILWSHFIDGKSVWTSIFWFGPHFKPILTPPVESRLDLSQIPESVSVFVLVPFKPKSSISQNHTSLLDKNVEQNDSVIIFKNGNWMGVIFSIRSYNSPISYWVVLERSLVGSCKIHSFQIGSHFVDQLDHHRNHHHEVIFLPLPFVSYIYTLTIHWGQCMR